MAMRRSRGVRSFTTRPPIRISPAVGVSRPAIIRKSVVFPEPEGPRKTRNSPSRVSKSTLLTAPSSPSLKTLVRFRVSTTAIKPPGTSAIAKNEPLVLSSLSHLQPILLLFPPVKDPLVLCFGNIHSLFRRLVAAGHGGKHRGDHPGVEGFINAGR